jgi:L-fucose dehydrogenase
VTGGSAGIGGAISLALAAEGAVPVVVARREPQVISCAISRPCNLRRVLFKQIFPGTTTAAGAVAEVRERFGPVYGLVNNASTNDGVGLAGGPAAFRTSLDQNILHYYTLAYLLLEDLKTAKGAIVNISSRTALTGQGQTSAYVAAKAAQLGLTREWAAALAPHGVGVNAVTPAEVMTPMYRNWLDGFDNPAAEEALITARIPLGLGMTTAEEIAVTVAFLLSRKASHTTGQ